MSENVNVYNIKRESYLIEKSLFARNLSKLTALSTPNPYISLQIGNKCNATNAKKKTTMTTYKSHYSSSNNYCIIMIYFKTDASRATKLEIVSILLIIQASRLNSKRNSNDKYLLLQQIISK